MKQITVKLFMFAGLPFISGGSRETGNRCSSMDLDRRINQERRRAAIHGPARLLVEVRGRGSMVLEVKRFKV